MKSFSGTATYFNEFEVSNDFLAHDGQLELDLGELRNVAEVVLNGEPLGIRWKPPFSYDVTDLVRPAKNKPAIKITHPWVNRLAGGARFPRDKCI